MALDLNFGPDSVKQPDFEPAPEGNYRLVVADYKVEDKPKGKYVTFQFEIADGEHQGKKIWEGVSVGEASRWKLQEILEGISGKEHRDDNMTIDLDDYKGMTFGATLYIDSYYSQKKQKDVLQNKVSAYLPAEDVQQAMSI